VNISDFCIEFDVAANVFEQANEARNQRARPALGEPDTALTFKLAICCSRKSWSLL